MLKRRFLIAGFYRFLFKLSRGFQLGPIARPSRHRACCVTGGRSGRAQGTLLWRRLPVSSHLLARRPAELAARNPLPALDGQRQLRCWRASFCLLSTLDLDAGCGAWAGSSLGFGSCGYDVFAAVGDWTCYFRTCSPGAVLCGGHAGRLCSTLLGLCPLYRVRARCLWRVGGRLLDSSAAVIRVARAQPFCSFLASCAGRLYFAVGVGRGWLLALGCASRRDG